MYEAIERLRELLMERGIEYETAYIADDTYWNVNGIRWHAFESAENTLWIACNSDVDFTPEQVIAITLGEKRSCASCPEMDNPDSYIAHLHRALEVADGGVRTCQIEERHGDWYCTGCGEMVGTCDTTSEHYIDGNAIEQWRHCPNCGRRIG